MYADLAGLFDVEVDTGELARDAWTGVEPDLSRWLASTALPQLQSGIAAGFEEGLSNLIPKLRQELVTPAPIYKAYAAVGVAWAFGLLLGLWIVARNTGRELAPVRGRT